MKTKTCLALGAWHLLTACGGSQKPNPLPPEEPMDQSGSSSADSTTTPTTTAASTDSSSSSADPSAGLSDPTAGGGSTTTSPAPTPDATDADPKGKGKKGKKGKGGLSKAQCDAVVDHEIDIVISTAGLDPSTKAMMKQQAASDPSFQGLMTECLTNTTQAQYKCAMAAKSKDELSKCDSK